MRVIKKISFYVYDNDGITLEQLLFELTKKGLKYVWIEKKTDMFDTQKYRTLMEICGNDLVVDFKIRDKTEWFTSGVGIIKIPFKESHLL